MADLWNSDKTDDDSTSATTEGPADENDDLKSNNINSNDYNWDMDWKRSSFFPFEDRELPTFAIIYWTFSSNKYAIFHAFNKNAFLNASK